MKGKITMKKILMTIATTIILTGIGTQASAYSSFSSTPNIFGGYNFSGNGLSYSTTPNIFGGSNYSGDISGSSTPNIFGGYNFTFY
jgi:hypothetical protein